MKKLVALLLTAMMRCFSFGAHSFGFRNLLGVLDGDFVGDAF